MSGDLLSPGQNPDTHRLSAHAQSPEHKASLWTHRPNGQTKETGGPALFTKEAANTNFTQRSIILFLTKHSYLVIDLLEYISIKIYCRT